MLQSKSSLFLLCWYTLDAELRESVSHVLAPVCFLWDRKFWFWKNHLIIWYLIRDTVTRRLLAIACQPLDNFQSLLHLIVRFELSSVVGPWKFATLQTTNDAAKTYEQWHRTLAQASYVVSPWRCWLGPWHRWALRYSKEVLVSCQSGCPTVHL